MMKFDSPLESAELETEASMDLMVAVA